MRLITHHSSLITGALCFLCCLLFNSVRGQTILEAPGLAAFCDTNSSGGGGGPSFSYSIIAHSVTNASANLDAVCGPIDCTGANLIILGCGEAGGTENVGDTSHNTYTAGTGQTAGGGLINIKFYRCISPTVTSSMYFTNSVPSGTGYPSIFVMAVKKTGGTPVLDVESGTAWSTGFSTTFTFTSVTPAGDNELGLAVQAVGTSFTATLTGVDSGFTVADKITASGLAYVIQTTATTSAPTFTWNQSSENAAAGVQIWFK